ncbi:MAG: hypothetical protein ACO3D1_05990 [Ilumatobacteraceae bacterium]|nr:hypothetical protein [Actinomycetota bacterium]NCZ66997.1 hypothetical protein [Acidimicrobiia bacterium]NCV09801.1 hypothetical protein [Actinomycetota bacterium]NCX31193.1 hypothetical protein [Actinomycetota bacterium]NCX78425.1 hypothetical protein [Actinomycetota bacterium]
MKQPRAAAEVEALLAQWSQRDDEAGNRAAARRQAALSASGASLVRDYEFHKKPNDWIHLDWLRPIRFVYRNLPFGLRMALKKRLAR